MIVHNRRKNVGQRINRRVVRHGLRLSFFPRYPGQDVFDGPARRSAARLPAVAEVADEVRIAQGNMAKGAIPHAGFDAMRLNRGQEVWEGGKVVHAPQVRIFPNMVQ